MTANVRHAAGSLLVVGLAGTELTGLERAWLKLVHPAGVILFRRNIADAAQTRALLSEILIDVVANGGSVSFMHPLDTAAADAYWDDALAGADRAERVILAPRAAS